MVGSDAIATFWQQLPPSPGPEQDAAILGAHRAGLVEHRWHPLVIGDVHLLVSERAATVGGRRLRYSARCQQRVADHLDALLLSPTIVDSIWEQAAIRLTPRPLDDGHGGPAADMARTSAWWRHDVLVDAELVSRPGLIASEGKDWVLAPGLWTRSGRAANYGWHATRRRMLEPLLYGHGPGHSDYSQVGRWAARQCRACGEDVDLADVLTCAYGAELAQSLGGPLPSARPPWADPLAEASP